MSLSSDVRDSLWLRIRNSKPGDLRTTAPLLWAGFLTAMVVVPWLSPGYLFGTDWPGPRHIEFPTVVTSSAVLEALLSFVARLIGGELTGKTLVVATLFAAGALAYRAVPDRQFVSG